MQKHDNLPTLTGHFGISLGIQDLIRAVGSTLCQDDPSKRRMAKSGEYKTWMVTPIRMAQEEITC